MARALELAARGLYTTDPNPRVGCILVDGERVLGEGWHERAGEAHAEVAALRSACGPGEGSVASWLPGASGLGRSVRGATAYVTLEPCSHVGRTGPCADALIEAGVRRVVCAARDPNPRVAGSGIERLRAAGIAVSVGVLEGEARTLNVGYFSRHERGRPWVRLKLAVSLDGRTAPVGGGPMTLTGEAARADVQAFRARSSAILTGAGTVIVDDPRLDVRLAYGPWVRQPLKVVLEGARRVSPAARVFTSGGPSVLFTANGAGAASVPPVPPWPPAVEIVSLPVEVGTHRLDLGVVITRLAALEVNELLVECGAQLAASFLEARLVDELIVYVAPLILGADAAPLAALSALLPEHLPRFALSSVERFGQDVRLVLTPSGG
jgi:diaminohydroxyphosphoribosylaminopyrimidine deaminase/5-amino-6-(5-phosphoribosylamino)uracil reductase